MMDDPIDTERHLIGGGTRFFGSQQGRGQSQNKGENSSNRVSLRLGKKRRVEGQKRYSFSGVSSAVGVASSEAVGISVGATTVAIT